MRHIMATATQPLPKQPVKTAPVGPRKPQNAPPVNFRDWADI